MALTPEVRASLIELYGLAADATDEQINAAAAQAAADRALGDPSPDPNIDTAIPQGAGAGTPVPVAQVPEGESAVPVPVAASASGTVTVDAQALADTQARLARLEGDATARQTASDTEYVDRLVATGHIAPARRDFYVARITQPTSREAALGDLELVAAGPAMYPVTELGNPAETDDQHAQDAHIAYMAAHHPKVAAGLRRRGDA